MDQRAHGHGTREKIALAKAAAHLAQQPVLIVGLDAFGHNVHAQHPRQFNDRADNLQRLFAFRHAAHE